KYESPRSTVSALPSPPRISTPGASVPMAGGIFSGLTGPHAPWIADVIVSPNSQHLSQLFHTHVATWVKNARACAQHRHYSAWSLARSRRARGAVSQMYTLRNRGSARERCWFDQ